MTDALFQFAGRLHPMVLHLPIGLFAALVGVELWWLVRRSGGDPSLRRALAWLAALSAVAAAASGFILSYEPGYSGDTLAFHKWLGIGFAAALAAAAVFGSFPARARQYAAMLLIAGGLLIPAGHFGASMTHGEDFLWEPFASQRNAGGPVGRAAPADAPAVSEAAASLAADAQHIFVQYCASCHGASRQRGGLALHTLESTLRGGESGPAVVPGDPDASAVIARTRLPIDHEDRMPPKRKPQPTEAELDLLRSWIASGAHGGAPAGNVAAAAPSTPATHPEPPPPAAIEALRSRLVHVETIDPDHHALWIDFAAAPPMPDDQIAALLEPLKANTAELSLAGCDVGDGTVTLLAAMPRLRALDLSRTPVTTVQLDALLETSALERLNLSRTRLGDDAAEILADADTLQSVNLWNAGLTPAALAHLRRERAGTLRVESGEEAATSPAETEPPVALTRAAKTPVPAPSLEPVNATCPVSEKPIDAKFSLVHEGRVVAFCCENCALEFWRDPSKFTVKPK